MPYLVGTHCPACEYGVLDGPTYSKKTDLLWYECRRCHYQAPDLPLYRRSGNAEIDKMTLNEITKQITGDDHNITKDE